jgi:multidrug resistance efflux pump
VLVPLFLSASRTLYVLTAVVLLALWWSYVTPIDISVRARGIVRPEGDPIRVIAETGGRIEEVCVVEGQLVHTGDAVLQLDKNDLLLKRSSLETRIHFTELRLADLERQLSDETAIEQQTASVDSIDHEAYERQAQANVANARLQFARTDLLFHRGLVPRQAHEESRAALSKAEAEELRLSSRSLELKHAQSAARLRELKASATPIRSDVAMLYHELEQTALEIGRRTITSPTDGQVTSLATLHADEILPAGTTVGTVVATARSTIIESWLPTSDGTYVHPGQLVRLQSDSSNPNHDDAFDGTVLSISPDARFNESLEGTYRVLILPGKTNSSLRFGMTFRAYFVTRQEPLLWLLFHKVQDAFD